MSLEVEHAGGTGRNVAGGEESSMIAVASLVSGISPMQVERGGQHLADCYSGTVLGELAVLGLDKRRWPPLFPSRFPP